MEGEFGFGESGGVLGVRVIRRILYSSLLFFRIREFCDYKTGNGQVCIIPDPSRATGFF